MSTRADRGAKMRLFVLLRLELKRLGNELRLSMRESYFVASFVIMLVTLLFLNQGLNLFFRVPELWQRVLGAELFRNAELVMFAFPLWILYSVIKGFISNDLLNKFNLADTLILLSSPVSRREIYLSRYFRNLVRRLPKTILLFVSSSPVFLFFNLNRLEIIVLFFTTLVFIELNHKVSNVTFLATRTASHGVGAEKNVALVIVVLSSLGLIATVFSPLSGTIHPLNRVFNPSSIVSDTLTLLASDSTNTHMIIINLITLLLIYASLIVFSYLTSGSFDVILAETKESPRNLQQSSIKWIPFWKRLDGGFRSIPILWKDVITYLRERWMIGTLELMANYGMFILLFTRFEVFRELAVIGGAYNYTPVYLLPFIIILFLHLFSPGALIFRDEARLMWLLKTSDLSIEALLVAKYAYSVVMTLLYTLPLILMVLLAAIDNKLTVIFLVVNVIFIHSSIQMVASSFFFSYSKKVLDGGFMLSFVQIAVSFAIVGLYLSILFLHPSVLLFVSCMVISLVITKYGKPKLYYIIDLLSNFYVVGLISSLLIGFTLISFSFLQFSVLRDALSSSYNLVSFFIISPIFTFIIFKVSSTITTKNLIEQEGFQ
ncbi:MAG: hypothetical protein QGI87_04520 [Candidatus Bathyarchaeota archaeon]|nr:hypothetical protein [Candidatus Bathyarchaeota archaeon]